MRIVIFTSNALRHKFVANRLSEHADDALVISECRPSDASPADDHFLLRYETEKKFFRGNDFFTAKKVLPLIYGEANLEYTFDTVKSFKPDAMFVFGACIIKEPLLSLLPSGVFINLHLGLSPYYRGAGTNFWPFINKELEYIGSTILHIDAGIDTGDIIAHVRPNIEMGDNVHTVGSKVILESASTLIKIMNILKTGKKLNRVKQWKVPSKRYYKVSDFNEKVLTKYKNNLENGLIEKYLNSPKKKLKLISL